MAVNPCSYQLPQLLEEAVARRLAEWELEQKAERLWKKDASLWTGSGEDRWLGWLTIVEEQLADPRPLHDARLIASGGFHSAALLGMGGSSLCPLLLSTAFPKQPGFPELLVLDSVVPGQVLALERKLDLARTLFIVASKSGTTLEPHVMMEYFHHRLESTLGPGQAGPRFIAITDPGSKLEHHARQRNFRRVYHGKPEIGGRFSALSNFGLIPAAIMGLDVEYLLREAAEMVRACGPETPPVENPGIMLGIVLAEAARAGHDKLTLVASPGLVALGAWLEQLIAESTGKNGKAIIPVDREPLGDTSEYGADRIFAYLRLASAADPEQDRFIEQLAAAGQPIIRIELQDAYTLGQEFFRWEMATAVAGSILGINPFDQPHVQLSKDETHRLTEGFRAAGKLPDISPASESEGLKLFLHPSDAAFAARLDGRPVAHYLRAHLARLQPGDYFAILAFIESSPEHERLLQQLRATVRSRYRVATTHGFGPRYLHSTGQAHKGGPNTGLFLMITADDQEDVPVFGSDLTFGVVKTAQALGDFQVLGSLGRRVLRVHLPATTRAGLEQLIKLCREAVS